MCVCVPCLQPDRFKVKEYNFSNISKQVKAKVGDTQSNLFGPTVDVNDIPLLTVDSDTQLEVRGHRTVFLC